MWFKFWIRGERQAHEEEYFWFDKEPDANELKEHLLEWAQSTFTAAECIMTRTGSEQAELPDEKRAELIKQMRYKRRNAEHMLTVLTGKPNLVKHTDECVDYAARTSKSFCIEPCHRLEVGKITEAEYLEEVKGKSKFDTSEQTLRAALRRLVAIEKRATEAQDGMLLDSEASLIAVELAGAVGAAEAALGESVEGVSLVELQARK